MFDLQASKKHRRLSLRQQENLLIALGQIKARKMQKVEKLLWHLGETSLNALIFCCFHSGIEALEKELKWPARSGWTCLGLIADHLENFYTENDRKIG